MTVFPDNGAGWPKGTCFTNSLFDRVLRAAADSTLAEDSRLDTVARDFVRRLVRWILWLLSNSAACLADTFAFDFCEAAPRGFPRPWRSLAFDGFPPPRGTRLCLRLGVMVRFACRLRPGRGLVATARFNDRLRLVRAEDRFFLITFADDF